MEVAVTTDVGSGQRFNDDAWCHEQLHRNVTLLGVADGFGRPQGAPSASIVLETVRDVVRRELRRATFPPRSLTSNDMRDLLVSAFADGNERLLELGGGSLDHVAVGSTCTVALIVSNQAFVAHVGDSRAYLLRRGELVMLTSDESIQPEFVRSGSRRDEPAKPSRQGPALLTRALGVESSQAVPPKIAHYTLHAHDALLLCTDGVSRAIGAAELQSGAALRDTARAAAERVVALARGAGSTDNATVILARNATVHGPPGDSAERAPSIALRWAVAVAAALALLVVSGAAVRQSLAGDAHLYLAQDAAGDVGLFAGAPGALLGVPLHVEREAFALRVARLPAAQRRLIAAGIPVASARAADAIVTRWQARSRH